MRRAERLSVKCVICHGEEIVDAAVFEEIAVGADIVRIPITVLVCQTCGERYYDRPTVRSLERIREEVAAGRRPLEQVGQVLQVK